MKWITKRIALIGICLIMAIFMWDLMIFYLAREGVRDVINVFSGNINKPVVLWVGFTVSVINLYWMLHLILLKDEKIM